MLASKLSAVRLKKLLFSGFVGLGAVGLYHADLTHKARGISMGVIGISAVALYFVERHPCSRSIPLGNTFRVPGFAENEIPDLSSKVIIVTGGNTGLGKASVAHLYHHNAHVILTARDVKKGEAAKADIIAQAAAAGRSSTGKIDVMELDLASLKNVQSFVAAFTAKKLPLHVLMLNAGIAVVPYSKTADGIESQFGVNHVAHHLLTTSLLPLLQSSAPSRVVVLSSESHRDAPPHGVGVSLAQINDESNYNAAGAYSQSKLANVLFMQELARRVEGKGVLVNAVHPGGVHTEVFRYVLENAEVPEFAKKVLRWMQRNVFYTAEEGALTQVYAAVGEGVEREQITGKYFVPIAQLEPRYLHAKAEDRELREQLWAFTEELIANATK